LLFAHPKIAQNFCLRREADPRPNKQIIDAISEANAKKINVVKRGRGQFYLIVGFIRPTGKLAKMRKCGLWFNWVEDESNADL
jgi:hypothetical protein